MASKYEVVKNWIENEANNRDLISVVSDVFRWDGSLDAYNIYSMDELADLFCDVKLTDFLSKLAPNFNYSDDGFRDTIYGIESCSMREVVYDIKDNIDEVVEAITNVMEECDIWITSSLKEKLDEE